MNHATLVAAMLEPSFYGPQVENVGFVQTHISSVFLTGERAYKLKKPVNFGFLNFSTLESREFYCQAEVDLNRRLAPDVYLGIAPITQDDAGLHLGGKGEVVDWVVVMRQMDAHQHGLEVLESGRLSERHIDQLIDFLVPFYREARTGKGIDSYGTLEAVKYNTDENFTQTREYVGKLISSERYEHIYSWTDRFFETRHELFEQRIAEGRIRESHGDLHLGNIFFEDPPVIFDCIEFNERFRCGDVAVDLAFLAMDLDFRGRPDLSRHLIDSYIERSGDHGLLELLDFYKTYRAYVRGKICCFTSSDPALDDAARREQRNLARHYFGLAYRYADGKGRPPLVVVHGLMGTGKTDIARFLRDRYGWHVLSTDAVRKQMSGVGVDTRVYVPYDTGLYSPEMNQRTYAEVCARAENLLEAGFPVVVDGSFKRNSERQPLIDLANRASARLLLLEATCDPVEQRRRLESRRLHDTRSDGRVELMDRQRTEFEPPTPEQAEFFAQLPTDGARERTRRDLVELLRVHGLLGGEPVRAEERAVPLLS
jgi:aminoglycoside phosphotransferase family enzyme/predicted kinase